MSQKAQQQENGPPRRRRWIWIAQRQRARRFWKTRICLVPRVAPCSQCIYKAETPAGAHQKQINDVSFSFSGAEYTPWFKKLSSWKLTNLVRKARGNFSSFAWSMIVMRCLEGPNQIQRRRQTSSSWLQDKHYAPGLPRTCSSITEGTDFAPAHFYVVKLAEVVWRPLVTFKVTDVEVGKCVVHITFQTSFFIDWMHVDESVDKSRGEGDD